ncbi:hypothetical protein MSG28_010913 [Choristoneura fumiferana]|uniref:Uncharacterized protein n=1 Tax=Choristoneura fumiferana TaxID=7141 RepID=A0ACC0KQC0_CHOFU|nr:hypothetical protein MSG28_010913 [Choristoneura fumiferana]
MYADDLKFSRAITSPEDVSLLQLDVNSLSKWCEYNNMNLNPNKCLHIKFTRKRTVIPSTYNIDGHILNEVDSIRDLGVILDGKLTFIPHIENIIKRASRVLGFVIRNTKSFKSSKSKILVYNSLVRSILEYCSVVWRPHYATHSLRLERIQKRFLRHMAYHGRIKYLAKRRTSYRRKLKYFNMDSLETRRVILNVIKSPPFPCPSSDSPKSYHSFMPANEKFSGRKKFPGSRGIAGGHRHSGHGSRAGGAASRDTKLNELQKLKTVALPPAHYLLES